MIDGVSMAEKTGVKTGGDGIVENGPQSSKQHDENERSGNNVPDDDGGCAGRHLRPAGPALQIRQSFPGRTARLFGGGVDRPHGAASMLWRRTTMACLSSRCPARAVGTRGRAYELVIVRKDGSIFRQAILGAPALIDGRPASVGTVLDISVQKAAEQRIRELADYDVADRPAHRRLLRDALSS